MSLPPREFHQSAAIFHGNRIAPERSLMSKGARAVMEQAL
jgi:hypothetical protein